MRNPLSWIDGWKTEIGIAAALIIGIVLKLEWISAEMAEWLFVAVATWTGVAIKHSIKKAQRAARGAYHATESARMNAFADKDKRG